MRIRNAPYWVLLIVLTPFTPLAGFLIRRQKWPYNPGGPMDRAWSSR